MAIKSAFIQGLARALALLLLASWACNPKSNENTLTPYVEPQTGGGLAAPVALNGKWGFVSPTGDTLVSFVYDWAGTFAYNRCCVRLGRQYGVIDSAGKTIDAFAFFKQPLSFNSFRALYFQKGLAGYLNVNGQPAIKPRFKQAEPFSEGRAAVLDSAGWTYIDTAGKPVFKNRYRWCGSFSEGRAAVFNGYYYGYINAQADSLTPFQFQFAAPFKNGLAAVKKEERWGFINAQGKIKIAPQWDYAHFFSDNRALVRQNDQFGFIDTSGTLVIPCQYSRALPFSNGLAAVFDGKRWGFIDTKGEWAVKPQFEDVADAAIEAVGRLKFAYVVGMSEGVYRHKLAAVKKDGHWGYINTSGQTVLPFVYEDARAFDAKNSVKD